MIVRNAKRPAPNPLRIDPSRTATLRRAMIADLRRRFARLRLDIIDLVDREDAFGLRVGVTANVFCPNGPGGGVDPTCSPGGGAAFAGKVDLSGIEDAAVSQRVTSTLSDLHRQFGVRLTSVNTGTMEKDLFDNAAAAQMLTLTTSRYRDGDKVEEFSHHLTIDRDVWKNQETLRAYRATLPNGYLADPSAAGMIRHEYAHALEKAHPESAQTIREVYAAYRKNETVSGYSGTSSREMLAEAFSHYLRQGTLEGTGLERLAPVFDSWRTSEWRPTTRNVRSSTPITESTAISGHTSNCSRSCSVRHVGNGSASRTGFASKTSAANTQISPTHTVSSSGRLTDVPIHGAVVPLGNVRNVTEGRTGSHSGGTVRNTRYAFLSRPAQLRAFTAWLREQARAGILGGTPGAGGSLRTANDLWQAYVEAGFRKGAGRAFDDTSRVRRTPLATTGQQGVPLSFGPGSPRRDDFVRMAFNLPETIEKVEILASRVYTELEGVTDAMAQQLTRTLADGLVQGKNPRDIARDLAANVDGIGMRRAENIARTEIVRAHAEGALTGLELLGVEEVGVMVEWVVTHDARLCPACRAMEGVVLKISEARGRIPLHVGCRCTWTPANVGERTAGQKRTKAAIERAVSASRKAGGTAPKRRIAKKRPESILGNAAPLAPVSPDLLAFSRFLASHPME